MPVQHHLHFVSINVVGSMSPGSGHAERTLNKKHTRASPSAICPTMQRRHVGGIIQFLLEQPFCIFRYATDDAAEAESIAEEAHNHPINSTNTETSSPWSSGYRGADQSCGRQ